MTSSSLVDVTGLGPYEGVPSDLNMGFGEVIGWGRKF